MGLNRFMAAACVAALVAGAGVANAAVYVQSVEAFSPGGGVRTPDGYVDATAPDYLAQALARVNSVDRNFLSLGTRGSIVLGFGAGPFVGTTLFEVTNGCAATTCGHWPESVEVHYGDSANGGWTLAGTISNSVAPSSVSGNTRGYTLDIATPFSFLRLVDTSNFGSESNAGWDIDAVSVAPIPVPAALPLLLAGLGGIAWVGRRRAKAA